MKFTLDAIKCSIENCPFHLTHFLFITGIQRGHARFNEEKYNGIFPYTYYISLQKNKLIVMYDKKC